MANCTPHVRKGTKKESPLQGGIVWAADREMKNPAPPGRNGEKLYFMPTIRLFQPIQIVCNIELL